MRYEVLGENGASSGYRKTVRWMVRAALVVVVATFGWGCEKKDTAVKGVAVPPVEVTAADVSTQEVPFTAEFIAQTQSSRLVNINARITGFLEKRVYTEGSIVKEGQTLFMMDQKPFKVQLDQAKAALARQEAALEVARHNLARVKPLAGLNALSQKDLDDATGKFQTSSADVEQAKAQLEQAKLNYSYTIITSPVAGITSAAQQTDGTYISQMNSQLTTVAVLSPMWVNFSVSENQMQRVRDEVEKGILREPAGKHYSVEVILVDGSVFPHKGTITFAEPSFNPQTGTFLIRVSIDNPQGILRPNQYVKVRLLGAVRPNAILVPQRAVRQGAKGHFVWLVDKENKAQQRPVTVGEWYGKDWVILEGLGRGDKVVVDGGLTLRAGAAVSVKPYKADADPAAGGAQPAAAPGRSESKQGS